VIGIGTRYADFHVGLNDSISKPRSALRHINTAEFDAYKVGAIRVVADARVALEQLARRYPAKKSAPSMQPKWPV